MGQIRLCDLKVDLAESVYPRVRIDGVVVSSMAGAIKAGETLDHMIVDARDNRVNDGNHRKEAFERCWRPETVVDVEFRDYRNDAEAFLDAVRTVTI